MQVDAVFCGVRLRKMRDHSKSTSSGLSQLRKVMWRVKEWQWLFVCLFPQNQCTVVKNWDVFVVCWTHGGWDQNHSHCFRIHLYVCASTSLIFFAAYACVWPWMCQPVFVCQCTDYIDACVGGKCKCLLEQYFILNLLVRLQVECPSSSRSQSVCTMSITAAHKRLMCTSLKYLSTREHMHTQWFSVFICLLKGNKV